MDPKKPDLRPMPPPEQPLYEGHPPMPPQGSPPPGLTAGAVADAFATLPESEKTRFWQMTGAPNPDRSEDHAYNYHRMVIVGLFVIAILAGIGACVVFYVGQDGGSALLAIATTIVGGIVGMFRAPQAPAGT